MAVNLAGLITGVAILLALDWSAGLQLGLSISNIGIVLIVGIVISLTCNAVMKRQYLKDRQTVFPLLHAIAKAQALIEEYRK